jgi:hypothetical protein
MGAAMTTEKNPSIFDDRGTIGSSDELDQYGVWVKSEPQDFSAPAETAVPDLDLGMPDDFSPEETENPEGEFFLSNDFPPTPDGAAGFGDIETPDIDFPVESSLETDEMESDVPIPERKKGETDFSTQLLMRIADELTSIKEELTSLKSELSEIRKGRSAEAPRKERSGGGFFDEDDDDKIALTGDELDNIIHTADFTEETGADEGESLIDDFDLPVDHGDLSAEQLHQEDQVIDLSESEDITPGEDPFTGETVADAPEPAALPQGAEKEAIYDGTGKKINLKFDDSPHDPSADSPETAIDEVDFGDVNVDDISLEDTGPINFSPEDLSELEHSPLGDISSADNEHLEAFLELNNDEALKILQESGIKPMTSAPEDTSYLEEDPLIEEHLDLTDAVIDEPDLSKGIVEIPLEEPSLDILSLIDLDNVENISGEIALQDAESAISAPVPGKEAEEEPIFDEVSFEDFSIEGESFDLSALGNLPEGNSPEESAFTEVSFEDELLSMETNVEPEENISFEMLPEDADIPMQENIQENVITDDSFETLLQDDPGGFPADGFPGAEDSNADSEKLELPNDEIDEFFKKAGIDDFSFEDPYPALEPDTAQGALSEEEALDLPDLNSLEFSPEDPADLPGENPAVDEPFPDESSAEDISLKMPEDFSMEIPENPVEEPAPEEIVDEEVVEEITAADKKGSSLSAGIPADIKTELKNVLSYMDRLLESLPEEKIEEFAKSEYFETYKKLFAELGLG